jgi:hypothetical protein
MKIQDSGFRVREMASGRRKPAEGPDIIANCKLQIANCIQRCPHPIPLPTNLRSVPGEGTVDSAKPRLDQTRRSQTVSYVIHPSSLILHPSSLVKGTVPFSLRENQDSPPWRRGISLLEVLISIFVLAIGLLGVAAIIPLGQISLWETAKADRAGACGRAALRNAEVLKLLDYRYWYWQNGVWGINPDGSSISDDYPTVSASYDARPFVIDPLGYSKGLNLYFGGALPRRTLRTLPFGSTLINENTFFWPDDLLFETPKDVNTRPSLIAGGTSEGNYSCFYSVMPAGTELSMPVGRRRHFTVLVVVCYKRNFEVYDPSQPLSATNNLEGEHTAAINSNSGTPQGFPGMGLGGGTVVLNNQVNVKENQWVMLYHLDSTPQLNRCHWYRVVGVGKTDLSGTTYPTLSLVGPDWDPSLSATLVVVPGVIGVYTTTMELDNDLLR